MICPKCGENNSDNFRFCGMCGTLLEARRPSGAPVPNLSSTVSPKSDSRTDPRTASAPQTIPPIVGENAPRAANKQVPPISGSSMLGLNQPGRNQPSPNQPAMDSMRDRPFSGLDSFFESEQPKTSGHRVLLLVALLAALAGAGWWTYTNYLSAAEGRKPPDQNMAAAPTPDASSSQSAAPSATAPENPSENPNARPDSTQKPADAEAKPAPEEKSPTAAPATPPAAPVVTPAATPAKIVPHKDYEEKMAASEPVVPSPKAANVPEPAAADTADAAFRKGEAYLYGRGVPENCNEAVKFLKLASAKSNPKARSTFGTMYATGHCVARDLPTSYLWFAMALKADPNNQVLEEDLTAIWNQMTPPERQMATRMKQ